MQMEAKDDLLKKKTVMTYPRGKVAYRLCRADTSCLSFEDCDVNTSVTDDSCVAKCSTVC